jgi:hypothetical protein
MRIDRDGILRLAARLESGKWDDADMRLTVALLCAAVANGFPISSIEVELEADLPPPPELRSAP